MSRYVLLVEDENLEVVTGFEERGDYFFLTIADARTCTGEPGGFLFHNADHHPTLGMTLEEVSSTLKQFGMTMPPDLLPQLQADEQRCRIRTPTDSRPSPAYTISRQPAFQVSVPQLPVGATIRVLNWHQTSK